MDLIINRVHGGKLLWEKTGVYQDAIVFYSEEHNGSWRHDFDKLPFKGSLKIEGKTIFNYVFHDTFFEIQEVLGSGKLSEWQEVKISRVFCD
jgi:hypothetical protein